MNPFKFASFLYATAALFLALSWARRERVRIFVDLRREENDAAYLLAVYEDLGPLVFAPGLEPKRGGLRRSRF